MVKTMTIRELVEMITDDQAIKLSRLGVENVEIKNKKCIPAELLDCKINTVSTFFDMICINYSK